MDCVISCHFSLLIGNYFDLTLNLCVALYLRQPNHSFLFAEWVFFPFCKLFSEGDKAVAVTLV